MTKLQRQRRRSLIAARQERLAPFKEEIDAYFRKQKYAMGMVLPEAR